LPKFFRYDTILLRDYFDIAKNGCYSKVLISGNATEDECKEHWNKIVEENFEKGKSTFDFLNYVDTLDGYNHFLQEHNVITAQLIILHFQVDDEIIESLITKGYKIDTSGKTVYLESLINAIRRSRSILSTIKMKANDLEKFNQHIKQNEYITFDDVMATLILNLGFTVSDDITLARYNHFRKKIEERRKSVEV
jgi:hypothetical protein